MSCSALEGYPMHSRVRLRSRIGSTRGWRITAVHILACCRLADKRQRWRFGGLLLQFLLQCPLLLPHPQYDRLFGLLAVRRARRMIRTRDTHAEPCVVFGAVRLLHKELVDDSSLLPRSQSWSQSRFSIPHDAPLLVGAHQRRCPGGGRDFARCHPVQVHLLVLVQPEVGPLRVADS